MSGKGGGGGGSGNGKGGNGLAGVPAVSRKMVQSLKEIVSNFPEHEIYAMLKECDMDPNEAVSRLLSQDPFHEVKSKREKKKEHKDVPDSRSRATNYSSSRGGRAGTDRYAGRAGTNQFNSSGTDSGLLQARPVYKKENGANAPGGPTSSSGILGNNVNWQLPSHSDSVATEVLVDDGLSSSSQHGGLQSAWIGVPGQVSMADIVKKGRPQAKASAPSPSINSNNHHNVWVPPSASHQSPHSLHVSEANADQGFPISHDFCQNDEWPSIEHQSGASASSIAGVLPNSEYYGISTNLDEANRQQRSHLEECLAEDAPVETADNVGPASISTKSITKDNAGGASVFDDSFYEDNNHYQPHRHPFNDNEAEDGVSSMSAHLEHLNLLKDDQVEEPEEEDDSVVIPDHLQLHNPECLNLSFGSFGSGGNAVFPSSGAYASRPVKSNSEETSAATDVATIGPSNSRNSDYYEDEHLTSTSDGNLVQRTDVNAGSYGSPSISQPEVLKPESPPEAVQGNQYSFPSSSHGFTYDNSQQPDISHSHSQTNSQMQNLAPFSSVMGYTNSLPSALLASTVQTVREDIPYSPFPATQSMPAKYSNIASSVGGPTISMSEALRASSISTAQPNPQTLPGANAATGPSLPQHMAVNPYSQPTLPLGHFPNMISYPFLPQSYTYMPSAFQQAFPGNSTYHQSLAAALPQYKNSISASTLPQSAAVASGYGFGSSTSIHGGNFHLNPPAAAAGTTIGYEDVINSQFKDNNHMIALQQNENSPMWVHGPASRTMSAVPGSTYYSFQGQNQQSGGFRQNQQQQQQPSQHFGPPGYPNFYSQTGISLEHHHLQQQQQQQQNARESSLAGVSQVPQPSKQSHQQLWHNGY
ncbi:hypothetical protein QN277_005762 [Acacia crassicarpa]|uniref:GBF-interacting protein 1 N-terminal domain-containing protein n=1 Tax=Acacia crassicarpa TaxID=499986 RepID=A0AAE1IWY5_9FABA|nr:hypothetical protein QN277_005762 [Acacia crassicarpa]